MKKTIDISLDMLGLLLAMATDADRRDWHE
nr:MAG TPA: hypothetical protein [Caudoviricetes sp.]